MDACSSRTTLFQEVIPTSVSYNRNCITTRNKQTMTNREQMHFPSEQSYKSKHNNLHLTLPEDFGCIRKFNILVTSSLLTPDLSKSRTSQILFNIAFLNL